MKCTYFYDLKTGRIEYMVAPAATVIPDGVGVLHSDVVDMQGCDKYFVIDGALVLRPAMELDFPESVLVDEVWRIEGIPSGAGVSHPDGLITVDDGYVNWSSAVAGTFRFFITCFPYIEREVYVTVTEA